MTDLAAAADAAAARYATVEDSTDVPRIVYDEESSALAAVGLARIEGAWDAALDAARAASKADPSDRGRAAIVQAFTEDGGSFEMTARDDFDEKFFDGDALEYSRLVRDGKTETAARFRVALAEALDRG